jgi:hypothetical protein
MIPALECSYFVRGKLGLDLFLMSSTLPLTCFAVAVSSKGAETQAAVKALGAMRFLSALFFQIAGSSLAITLVVDSLGLRDGVVGYSRQSDGSVMIDVACLCESYHNRELKIAWCPTSEMLADQSAKSGADSTQLMKVLTGGCWVSFVRVRWSYLAGTRVCGEKWIPLELTCHISLRYDRIFISVDAA